MKTGVVKFFNETKGFGFIKPEGGGKDVFVHSSGVEKGLKLRENDKVSFEEENGKKGINAINVQLV